MIDIVWADVMRRIRVLSLEQLSGNTMLQELVLSVLISALCLGYSRWAHAEVLRMESLRTLGVESTRVEGVALAPDRGNDDWRHGISLRCPRM